MSYNSDCTAWAHFLEGWGDGTSRNDVSPYECSGTPGPPNESSRKHKVPDLIHPCHFAPTKTYCIMHIDRDVPIKGHCVTRDYSFGDQGSQNIRTGTLRFGTSRHPTLLGSVPMHCNHCCKTFLRYISPHIYQGLPLHGLH